MIFVEVNNERFPASISGDMVDYNWDNRSSKTITVSLDYDTVKGLFPDKVNWSIVMTNDTTDDDGNVKTTEDVFDNSEYSMSGPITDNRDGTCSIKMGKPTDLEYAYMMMIGG